MKDKTQKISIVVSAYNEEKFIADCLKSARSVADEIILVDNTSDDKTAEIAKKLADITLTRANNPVMLNINKNFGFAKASGDWIISLDADERITKQLSVEIRQVISDNRYLGFEIPRKN